MSHYITYYENQVGGGIDHVFVGSPYQRGNGIGSFLSGLFRKAVPLLTRGAKAIGKEALRTGISVLGDMTQSIPLKDSLKLRSQEATGNLKRRADDSIDEYMNGFGYKRQRVKKNSHSQTKPGAKRKSAKKKVSKRKTNKVKKVNKKKKSKGRKKKTAKVKRRRVTDIFGPA